MMVKAIIIFSCSLLCSISDSYQPKKGARIMTPVGGDPSIPFVNPPFGNVFPETPTTFFTTDNPTIIFTSSPFLPSAATDDTVVIIAVPDNTSPFSTGMISSEPTTFSSQISNTVSVITVATPTTTISTSLLTSSTAPISTTQIISTSTVATPTTTVSTTLLTPPTAPLSTTQVTSTAPVITAATPTTTVSTTLLTPPTAPLSTTQVTSTAPVITAATPTTTVSTTLLTPPTAPLSTTQVTSTAPVITAATPATTVSTTLLTPPTAPLSTTQVTSTAPIITAATPTTTVSATLLTSSAAPISTTQITSTTPDAAVVTTTKPVTVAAASTTTVPPNPTNAKTDSSNATSLSSMLGSLINIINVSFTGPLFGIEIPPEIKISVDFKAIPTVYVNVDNVPTTTDTQVIEVIRVNGEGDIRVGTSQGNGEISGGKGRENTLNIDLSGVWGSSFGTTSPAASVRPTFPTPTTRVYQQKCNDYYDVGRKNRRKRAEFQVLVVGGTYTNQKEFPHMAALGYGKKSDNSFLCGGSLISENYVVTAAHCVSAQNVGNIEYVRLGSTTLLTETLNSQDYNVVRRIPHPNYISGLQYNDIALLQLERPVQFSEYIAPICLYGGPSTAELSGTPLIATGWGRVKETGNLSPDLQKVDLEYFPNNVCRTSYSDVSKDQLPNGIIEDSQLCAGSEDGSKDTCQGDSGGPLQLQKDGRMYLVGITSFGVGCGRPGIPGVYTKVSNYLTWIEQVVWGQ